MSQESTERRIVIRYLEPGGMLPSELTVRAHCQDCASMRFQRQNRGCRILVVQG